MSFPLGAFFESGVTSLAMKYLLPLLLLFVSCASPKTYSEPEIGMDYASFTKVCGMALYGESGPTVTNANSSTTTYTLKDRTATFYDTGSPVNKERSDQCIGKFTFVNGTLDTITRGQ